MNITCGLKGGVEMNEYRAIVDGILEFLKDKELDKKIIYSIESLKD